MYSRETDAGSPSRRSTEHLLADLRRLDFLILMMSLAVGFAEFW
jgi:hypothetical protein